MKYLIATIYAIIVCFVILIEGVRIPDATIKGGYRFASTFIKKMVKPQVGPNDIATHERFRFTVIENEFGLGNKGIEKLVEEDVEVSEEKTKPFQHVFEAFDTQCAISIFGVTDDNVSAFLCKDMERVVKAYDKVFSKTNEESEIYEINHRTSNSVMVSDETATIFSLAKDFYRWSNKKFDISAGTLINLWDVKNRKTLPTAEEINEAKSHCGNFDYEIEWDVDDSSERKNRITFKGDLKTQYDFGGLIKGYCCDALQNMVSSSEVISACIVNLGGNVMCKGKVEGRKDGSFHVGIIKPFSETNEIIETIDVNDKNVITSGNYQRYFKIPGDDRVYHHIIDPQSGEPSNNGLDSVTIVSNNGLLGDYLSTACMLLGEEESKKLIDFAAESFEDKNIQAIFVRSNCKISKYPKNVTIK